jgi:putative peptidoglycan lipid II flippase
MYGGPFDYVSFSFAYSLFSVISGVFILSVANVVFPRLSRLQAAKDRDGFTETLRQTIRSLFFFLLPMTFGLMALNRPLVGLVLESGLFTESAADVTAGALFYFAPGIVGFGLQAVLSRACFSLRDGRTPLAAAAIGIAANACLAFLLVPRMGADGAAWATTAAVSLSALIMLAVLIRKGYVSFAKDAGDIIKMVLLTACMYGAVLFLRNRLEGWLLPLALPALMGVFIYFGGAWLLRLDELHPRKS